MPESRARPGRRSTLSGVLVEGYRPALGPGIRAGTTEVAVHCLPRHSGLDAGIQGRGERSCIVVARNPTGGARA